MGVAAGICFGIAIVWFPAAWVTKFRASGFLDWQRKSRDRSGKADERSLQRLIVISQRMLSLWPVPVAAAVAAVVLTVLASTS